MDSRKIIEPGDPNKGFTSTRLRHLNENWFLSLENAGGKIEAWRRDYNECRPHRSGVGNTPLDAINCDPVFEGRWKILIKPSKFHSGPAEAEKGKDMKPIQRSFVAQAGNNMAQINRNII